VKLYYDQNGITIYHGDCRDILHNLDMADLLLTDPPYGINNGTRWPKRQPTPWSKDYDPIVGDDQPFDPTHLLGIARHHVIFGGNLFSNKLPEASCWIVWDQKRNQHPDWNTAHGEMAWTDFACGIRIFPYLWDGYKRDGEVGRHVHPNQKPVALMEWIITRWTKPGESILDPYMGSGPVAKACQTLGRRYVGIEVEEEYCEATIERLAQPPLFSLDIL
jgi:site-specific DNA-methyltransferase (adenine-specific)/modification methylase